MLEKIIKKLDEMDACLFGEMIEADNAFDNEWCNQIFAKQGVLNELRDFVVNLQKEELA